MKALLRKFGVKRTRRTAYLALVGGIACLVIPGVFGVYYSRFAAPETAPVKCANLLQEVRGSRHLLAKHAFTEGSRDYRDAFDRLRERSQMLDLHCPSTAGAALEDREARALVSAYRIFRLRR
jgi:hypothetical protein